MTPPVTPTCTSSESGYEPDMTEGQRAVIKAYVDDGIRDVDGLSAASGLSPFMVRKYSAALGDLDPGQLEKLRAEVDVPPRSRKPPPTRRRGPDLPTSDVEYTNITLRITQQQRAEWEERRKAEGFTSLTRWIQAKCG